MEKREIRNGLIRFLLYLAVGFLAAFLYKYLKNN